MEGLYRVLGSTPERGDKLRGTKPVPDDKALYFLKKLFTACCSDLRGEVNFGAIGASKDYDTEE